MDSDDVLIINPEYLRKIDLKKQVCPEFLDSKQDVNNQVKDGKLKTRGKNTKRPVFKKEKLQNKLCPSVLKNEPCSYQKTSLNGDNITRECNYIHDVNLYLSNKAPDISPFCPTFNTFGYCPYSFSCRFATKHISIHKINDENSDQTLKYENLLNKHTWDELSDLYHPKNVVPKSMIESLRKRKYNFEVSNYIANMVNSNCVLKNQSSNTTQSLSYLKILQHLYEKFPDYHPKVSRLEPVDKELNADLDQMNTRRKIIRLDDMSGSRPLRVGNAKWGGDGASPLLYLAPLTTLGNLPFRRICKGLGADVTCSENALISSLLQGNPSEWALIKRHHSENFFGVQVCGCHVDSAAKVGQLFHDLPVGAIDFLDLNLGCPLDAICCKGAGAALLAKPAKVGLIVRALRAALPPHVDLTVKVRTGVREGKPLLHALIPHLTASPHGDEMGGSGCEGQLSPLVAALSIHGRSKERRYSGSADWNYVIECAAQARPLGIRVFGNGDIFSYNDFEQHAKNPDLAGVMIGRGALIKPWIFKEIKEQRHYDISSKERLDILKDFVSFGLQHWGSDTYGVETTRRFLLEWLSFLHRYVPVGILEVLPAKINQRPPRFYSYGRDDLECLMSSASCSDWIAISELLLGPVPPNFSFYPKHRSNAYTYRDEEPIKNVPANNISANVDDSLQTEG